MARSQSAAKPRKSGKQTKQEKLAAEKKAERAKRSERLNMAHEIFAQEVVKGVTQTEAYLVAFPDSNRVSAGESASRLLKTLKVAARVAELREAIAERNALTVDKVVAEARILAFSDMRDYLKFIEGGDVLLDFDNMPAEASRAIAEVTQETYFEGTGLDARQVKRTKFKLHPKIPAIEQLLKVLGAYAPVKVDVRDVSELSDDELAREAVKHGLAA